MDAFTRFWRLLRKSKHYPYLAYQAIALISSGRKDWHLMNYGYASMDGSRVELGEGTPEVERYALQLYHLMAASVPLEGRELLEVGSGRGGGAAYVHRVFRPRTTTGVDFSGTQIRFCRRVHRASGLYFEEGNAQSLVFADGSFDAVLNIESSHNYPDIDGFYRNVFRVLRPGGHFLYSDMRSDESYPGLGQALEEAGFVVMENTEINAEVMHSLELDNNRRRKLAEEFSCWPFRDFARLFAGTTDSYGYRKLQSGQSRYFKVVARRPAAA